MQRKNDILVTGGAGMVGSQATFGKKLTRKELDILSLHSIEQAIKKYKPRVILHLAAMTHMLLCEENPKEAFKVNVIGTKNLATICKRYNIKLVYMSTCAVFNGRKKTPYREIDTPDPINAYGKTKLEGEKIVQKLIPSSLIIRTGWLFGGGKNDKKFVQLTYKKFKEGSEVKATKDRKGSPTFVPDLLSETKKLIKENKSGIYHIVNSGEATYLDIAKEIRKIGKFNKKIIAVKGKDVELPKLKRGKLEALTSSKIKLRSWKKALHVYLTKLKK